MQGIVAGVDPSPAGRAALEAALVEGLARGVPVTAVRAWSAPHRAGAGPVEAAADAERLAQEELERARDRVRGGTTARATAVAVPGAPARVLVQAAREADLVVVGRRGAGPVVRAVLGSVSTTVLHAAACPVLVVPAPQARGPEPARVVVAVDHSPASLAALRYAVAAARRSGARLVPVHVQDDAGVTRSACLDVPVLTACDRRALEAAAAEAGAAGLAVAPEVRAGRPEHELRTAARPQDLLVVGSRGRGGFAGALLGSVSAAVARTAPGAVVVVRG